MRVAITGAHGVGKSTLAAAISERLGVPELPTPGRSLARLGLPVNEEASVTSQVVAWLMQFRFEREHRDWVSSRSLIDVWAYTSLAGERAASDPVEAVLLSELERSTRLAIEGAYEVLIYVPPVIPLVGDDVREADAAFQRSVDERITDLIKRWHLAHETVDVNDSDAVLDMFATLERRAS
jgi:predicted ATPase